jgi:hypothetical protein
MSYLKQGLLAVALLAVLIGTWLASRRKRKTPEPPFENDDLFGFDPVDPPPAAVEPQPIVPAFEVQEAAARRRALLTLAEEQPKDVATVLSGWLNSKDSDLNARGSGAWAPSLTGPKGGSR